MLPIIPIVREACLLALSRPVLVFKTLFITSLMGTISLLVLVGLSSFLVQKMGANPYFVGVVMTLLSLMVVMSLLAWLFNVWVNVGATGRENSFNLETSELVQNSLINGIKLFLIFILLLLVSVMTFHILSVFGINSLQQPMSEGGSVQQFAQMLETYDEIFLSNLTTNLLSIVTISFIYSFFSSNLTMTALGVRADQPVEAYQMNFAAILILINLIAIAPTFIFALAGMPVAALVAGIIMGFLLMFAVPAAHGIRYRLCNRDAAISNDDSMNMPG